MTIPGPGWGHNPYGGMNQPYRPHDPYSAPQHWTPPGPPQASYPGYPGPYGAYPSDRPSTNGLAIASLITSSISVPAALLGLLIVIIGLAGAVIGIVGIVLGIVALTQIKRTNQGGRGLAIAGIVVGVIPVAVALLGVIIVIVYLVSRS